MIIRAGTQSFEILRTSEIPKPLTFASQDEALKWVKRLGFLDSQAILEFRGYLSRFSDDPDYFRLTDHEAVERMAALLYSGKVAIVVREHGASGSPTPKTAAAPIVAFPLSERVPRAPSAWSKPAPLEDPSTFDAELDSVAQAAALVAAAGEGKAFCPE